MRFVIGNQCILWKDSMKFTNSKTLKNRNDLPRHIPAEIKREVRKNCGFGCVVCGSAFYEYEHFNPEYNEAIIHDPAGITLLCAKHHDDKTRGRMSNKILEEAAANPKCKQTGFSHGALEFGTKDSIVQIGSTYFIEARNIISVNGETILSIKKPEAESAPFLLTLVTEDSRNSNRVIDNEWIGDVKSWDITTIGRSITVRDAIGSVILDIENIPSEKFIINHINITFKGFKIETKLIAEKIIDNVLVQGEKVLTITNPQKQEIARLGSKPGEANEIKWENALEIVGNHMNINFTNVSMKNGSIYMLPEKNGPINFSGSANMSHMNFNFGADQSVQEFYDVWKDIYDDYKKINGTKYKINPKKIANYKTKLKVLRYTDLFNQFRLEDRQAILSYKLHI